MTGFEYTVSTFADDSKLSGILDVIGGKNDNYIRVEKWDNKILMEFSKAR